MNQTDHGNQKIGEVLKPQKLTSESMVYTNKVYISTSSALPDSGKFVSIKGFILKYQKVK